MEISRIGKDVIPGETSEEQKQKVKELQKRGKTKLEYSRRSSMRERKRHDRKVDSMFDH